MPCHTSHLYAYYGKCMFVIFIITYLYGQPTHSYHHNFILSPNPYFSDSSCKIRVLLSTLSNCIIQMKKTPSCPKITANTQLLLTQMHSINMNSPKAATLKKGFKSPHRKIKPTTLIVRKDSSPTPLKTEQKLMNCELKNVKKGVREV